MASVGSRVRWVAVLLAVILALPILGITLYFTHDVQSRIAAARDERTGLAHVALLQAFLTDSEAFAAAVTCPKAGTDVAALRAKAGADLAAIDAFQSGDAIPPRWPQVENAWHALGSASNENDFQRFFDPLAASFVSVSDQSGLTFDPDSVGIDLADSLAYRLPRAVEQFQSARRQLCAISEAPPIAARLSLQKSQTRGEQFSGDAFQDLDDAASHQTTQLGPVLAAYAHARAAAATTTLQMDAFLTQAAPGQRERTEDALAGLTASLYTLMSAELPTLRGIIDRRLSVYGRVRVLAILPGVLGTLAAIAVAILLLRLLLQNAALQAAEKVAAEQEHLAMHDSLTGLLTRRAFFAALESAVTSGPHHGALCLFDLDDFKIINDTYGHLAGDEILVRLARVIDGAVRGTDPVARLGGDEFAVFLRAPISRQGVERALATITRDASAPVEIRGQTFRSSVSAGATFIEDVTKMSIEDALAQADTALYQAKAAMRGRFVFIESAGSASTFEV
ncbi:MAG: diguanylate cyclase domain-containing protein [Vulcanimicrobiaceae bacterium]